MDFLKYWSAPYELIPRNPSSGKRRTGALLKFDFPEVGFGYADLHPFVEFGEPSLETHLLSLQSQPDVSTPTPLVKRAIQNALIDAQFRWKKKNLLAGIEQVVNNALILDVLDETALEPRGSTSGLLGHLSHLEQEGFSHLKIKVGQDPTREVSAIKQILSSCQLRLRLDANGKLTYDEAQAFLLKLTPAERARIEYFEDPCPFNQRDWARLRVYVPIGLDWQAEAALAQGLPLDCWDVVIVKPSRSDLDYWTSQAQIHQTKITVTSAMDHPLGVLMALAWALRLQTEFPDISMVAGCLTPELYQPNDFSARIKRVGPRVSLADQEASSGLGFAALLESQKWK